MAPDQFREDVRRAISYVNTRDRQPVVFYIHPWEVDPDQPRLPASRTTLWRHHVGMSTTMDKLTSLVEDFTFAPVADVLDAVVAPVPSVARLAHAK
jgi:hypothetical protein